MDVVKQFHPPCAFDISDKQSEACYSFLKRFLDSGGNKGNIYSTNYDLLLYWVFMKNDRTQHKDGFGGKPLTWGIYSDEQKMFYLHGMLAFFDNDNDVAITKEEYHSGKSLLENITNRMEHGEYPFFVSAGDGRQKLKHIRSNPYLTHCYDKLCEVEGSLVTFGFNFGEPDDHIVNAINTAAADGRSKRLLNLYIGAYIDKTTKKEDQKHIKQIKDKFKCNVHFYNTRTADIWGKKLLSK